jgi:imidazoleglycerol-phosphate dehydratase/histidinol-phosphatase
MQNILFIDRDGTLVEEPEDHQVDAFHKISFYRDVIPSLLTLTQAGYRLVMVTNQDGLGTDAFPEHNFQPSHDFIVQLFASQGIHFDEVLICPHLAADHCACRKPKTGLVEAYLRNHNMNRDQSWVIGDRESDKALAEAMGIAYLPIAKNHGWKTVVDSIMGTKRTASQNRRTRETNINISLVLDSDEPSRIATPIDFFSHMLEQVASHGGFCMQLKAEGDTQVDEHHLIEDTALVLGEALKQALGNKWGIQRYGFVLPMDESLVTLAMDLSGRPCTVFQAQFSREQVGGMATEMVEHFFQSLSLALGAAIHVKVEGKNHHHMIEACFKALGRTLNQAMAKTHACLPSTKGVL